MISSHWVSGIGLFAGFLVPLFGYVQQGVTSFQQGLTSGGSPTAVTLGPDGASWFVESQAQQIGRITPAGLITEYPIARAAAGLNGIATGPDGAIWFTEGAADRIGRMTTDGVLTNEFSLAAGSVPFGIVNGLDGAVWFTEQGTGKIGRMTPGGALQEYPLPWTGSQLFEITVGPRGSLWFTDGSGNIGLVSTIGAFTRFPLPNAGALPRGITPGPDNAVWFTESAAGKIGRIDISYKGPPSPVGSPSGIITEYAIPSGGRPQSIILGPDGAFWFTEAAGAFGKISINGEVTEYNVSWAGSRPSGIIVGPDAALWFTDSGGRIARVLPAAGGLLSEFPLVLQPNPSNIMAGPDGALWFTADVSGIVARINTAGAINTAYQASSFFTPYAIAQGSDGAVWFTERYRSGVGKIVGANRVEYQVPFTTPFGITAGPDGAIWFTDVSGGSIGRITTAGMLTIFAVPNAISIPGITVGPDGALWFTMVTATNRNEGGSIGRMTTSGVVTEYPIPTPQSGALGITPGADGALWFTEIYAPKVGRITTSGAITEFPVAGAAGSELIGITAGPDGSLWFGDTGHVFRITPSGELTTYPMPDPGSGIGGITSGPDGAIWFVETAKNEIGRLTTPLTSSPTTTRFFVTNPPGLKVTVDDIDYTTPRSFTWPVGSRHTVSVAAPAAGNGVRYAFTGWSDGQSQSHAITTGPGPSVFAANFSVQYRLDASVPSSPFAHTPWGSVAVNLPSIDGFYDASAALQLTASAIAGYRFAGWETDSGMRTNNPLIVVMDRPRHADAIFNPDSCAVTLVESSAAVSVAGGSGTFSLNTGSDCYWITSTGASWVSADFSGFGSATRTYTVAPSPGGVPRTAVLDIGGQLFTITQGLRAVGVTPAAGAGQSQLFTLQFANPDGYQKIGIVNVLINSALDARQGCYLAYSQPLHVLYLTNDQGVATGPGTPVDGSSNASNTQCLFSGAGSTATGSGGTLTLTLNLSFSPNFAGSKVVYLAVQDPAGNSSGWQALGTWNVPAVSVAAVAVGTVTPARSNTAGQAYTFTFTDSKGVPAIGVVNILMNTYLLGYGACYLAYSQPLNVLYLVNDSGNSLSTGLRLNADNNVVSNSQCTVYGAGSTSTIAGNTLTLTLNLAFLPGWSGDRVIYLAARNASGSQNTGWQPAGSVTVP